MTQDPAPFEPVGRELVEYVEAHLDRSMDRIQKAHEPIWKAHAEMGQTIVTMSSSALILSIAVVHFLYGKLPTPGWPGLLPLAWILFGLSILLGAVRSSWAGQAQALRAVVESKRSDIRSALWRLEPGEDHAQRVEDIIGAALKDADAPIAHAIKGHGAITQAMFWCFASAFASLITFAIKNLPF